MNFTIYVEDAIGYKVSYFAKSFGKTRNAIVREALEEWCARHNPTQWEPGFFDFEAVEDCPNFSMYRHELKPFLSSDPLQ